MATEEKAGKAPTECELLEHLKDASQDVFDTMVHTVAALVPGAPEEGTEARGGICVETASGCRESRRVDLEACVDFAGSLQGTVVLRCTMPGAYDLARGLLMLDASDELDVAAVKDALGECANMVAGALKTRAFNHGDARISIPRIEQQVQHRRTARCGQIVYQLTEGCVAIEVWVDPKGPIPGT